MYCIKIPKKDIWRHRNHIQNYFFLEFNPENMPAVANVGFSYNWQGFIYLIQIIHWFKIQIGLLNGSPSKVGMLVTIEIFFAFSTVVWPKRNSTSTVTQIYLIQFRRYNFKKCDFIALLICCLCEQIVQLIIFLNYLHNRELTGTCYEQKTDKM